MRLWRLIFVIFCVVLSGCGQTSRVFESSNTPDFQKTLPNNIQDDQATFYTNSRYGYRFEQSEGVEVLELQLSDQTATKATEHSDVVFIEEGESNFLSIRFEQTTQTIQEWLGDHLLFFYPTGNAAQSLSTVSTHQAVVFHGSGEQDTPAGLMVIQTETGLFIVTWEKDVPLFEFVLNSLEIL